MAGSDEGKGAVKPSDQRGGRTPGAAEIRKKGEWAGVAAEGLVPAELGESDPPQESPADDQELGSSVLGVTTGSEEPATEDGVDLGGGENADATADGGPKLRPGVEPALKDAASAQVRADQLRADGPSDDN